MQGARHLLILLFAPSLLMTIFVLNSFLLAGIGLYRIDWFNICIIQKEILILKTK